MKLTILNTSDTLVSFRMQLESGDNVYESKVDDNCKYPETFKNDFVCQNSQRCINQDVINFNPEVTPEYEPVNTFNEYFGGVELIATNPDFIAAVELYLTEKHDFIFVG